MRARAIVHRLVVLVHEHYVLVGFLPAHRGGVFDSQSAVVLLALLLLASHVVVFSMSFMFFHTRSRHLGSAVSVQASDGELARRHWVDLQDATLVVFLLLCVASASAHALEQSKHCLSQCKVEY